ncbi:hypothetical protein FIBSPDRAFT_271372 [Athelia psychrophila]|uniref:Uncharacterized protein n=1 Tax=Athelia psychrophila TaxID=1759441 RepID=A0A165WXH2_9AGAM|nr:hypothetical protein FIBSPDRAFT_271372 [Fibularhizoctonia sp. CBS 109695]
MHREGPGLSTECGNGVGDIAAANHHVNVSRCEFSINAPMSIVWQSAVAMLSLIVLYMVLLFFCPSGMKRGH